MAIGLNWHPLYLSGDTWMIIVGIYIAIASVTPVWILLQPRDYLSSFLLYGMMIVAVIGIFGAHPTIDIPAFTSFVDKGYCWFWCFSWNYVPGIVCYYCMWCNLWFPFISCFWYYF